MNCPITSTVLPGYHLSQRLCVLIQKIRHFERDIIGVTDKQELQRLFLPAVEKDPSVKTLYLNSFSPVSFAALINFDRLDTLAGSAIRSGHAWEDNVVAQYQLLWLSRSKLHGYFFTPKTASFAALATRK